MPTSLERGDPLGGGGKLTQVHLLNHVAERQKAGHEHVGRGVAADVLGTERPVDAALTDTEDLQAARPPPSRPAFAASWPARAGAPEAVDPEPGQKLRAGEHAAMEARQNDPLSPATRRADSRKRAFASLQMSVIVRSLHSATRPRGPRRFVTTSLSVLPKHGVGKRRKRMGSRTFPTALGHNGMGESRSGHSPPATPFHGVSKVSCTNADNPLARKSTRRKRPIVSGRVKTSHKVSGPWGTAASGLSKRTRRASSEVRVKAWRSSESVFGWAAAQWLVCGDPPKLGTSFGANGIPASRGPHGE